MRSAPILRSSASSHRSDAMLWALDPKHSERSGYGFRDYETTAIAYRDTFGARLRRRYITACPRRTSSPILQNLAFGTHTPLTAASTLTKSKVCADHPFVRSAVHTQRKTERRCYAPGLLKPR